MMSVVLAAALLAACGSGSATPHSADRSSTSQAIASPSQANRALVKRVLLTLADLPPGWIATPHEGAADTQGEAQLETCLKSSVTPLHIAGVHADAWSPDFRSAAGAGVSEKVAVAPHSADVHRVLSVLSNARLPRCFGQFMDSQVKGRHPAGVTFGSSTVERLAFAHLGDATFAFRFAARITAAGQSSTVYADIIFVTRGRVLLGLVAESIGTPFDTGLSASLLSRSLGRIATTARGATGSES